jgi:hypothetical protein
VTQCGGSCYFEGAVSPIEAKLSILMGRPVTISRPYLLANLLLLRLTGLAVGGKGVISFAESKNGSIDILSNGSLMLMAPLLNNANIRILEKKSQAYIYRENAVIKKMFAFVGRRIFEILKSRPQNPGLTTEERAAQFKSLFMKNIGSIAPGLKRILEEANLGVPQPVEIKVKMKSTDLKFENQGFLSSDLEAKISEVLSKKEELTLSYFHVPSLAKKIDGRDGFLNLPEAPPSKVEIEKQNLGGGHAAALVDIIKDSQGRIEFLVVRNSWGGQGDSDKGYHYISTKYLSHYGASIIEWMVEIKPKETAN